MNPASRMAWAVSRLAGSSRMGQASPSSTRLVSGHRALLPSRTLILSQLDSSNAQTQAQIVWSASLHHRDQDAISSILLLLHYSTKRVWPSEERVSSRVGLPTLHPLDNKNRRPSLVFDDGGPQFLQRHCSRMGPATISKTLTPETSRGAETAIEKLGGTPFHSVVLTHPLRRTKNNG